MTKNKRDVLIVEDRGENLVAAREYFDSREDVNLDIATDYNSGIDRIHSKLYSAGIFDLEIPRREGLDTEKLGVHLAKEATKYIIPSWAVMTSGIDHHNAQATFVSYSFDPFVGDGDRRFREITEIPKDNPNSWKTIYENIRAERDLNVTGNWTPERRDIIMKIIGPYNIGKEDEPGYTLFLHPPFDKKTDRIAFEMREIALNHYLKKYGERFTLEDSLVESIFKGHKLLESK